MRCRVLRQWPCCLRAAERSYDFLLWYLSAPIRRSADHLAYAQNCASCLLAVL